MVAAEKLLRCFNAIVEETVEALRLVSPLVTSIVVPYIISYIGHVEETGEALRLWVQGQGCRSMGKNMETAIMENQIQNHAVTGVLSQVLSERNSMLKQFSC